MTSHRTSSTRPITKSDQSFDHLAHSEEADLKPHKSVYWLNSHDPDFDAKAERICSTACRRTKLYQHGELVICCDEKTGMQFACKYADPTSQVGEKTGDASTSTSVMARALLASFAVPTGEVAWNLGTTRTSDDFVAHLRHAANHFPEWTVTIGFWTTSTRTGACRYALVAEWCDIPLDAKTLRHGKERRAF